MKYVPQTDIQNTIQTLELSDQSVCIHSSLKSFGHVNGGALTVVHSFVDEKCTLLVPTFSDGFSVPPPKDNRPSQNGWDYDNYLGSTEGPHN